MTRSVHPNPLENGCFSLNFKLRDRPPFPDNVTMQLPIRVRAAGGISHGMREKSAQSASGPGVAAMRQSEGVGRERYSIYEVIHDDKLSFHYTT